MVRYRTDNNQKEIVKVLRRCGCSVQILSDVGDGCPDILAGLRRKNYLFELKNPEGSPSQQALTPKEEIWHQTWNGQVEIVKTLQAILKVLNLRA